MGKIARRGKKKGGGKNKKNRDLAVELRELSGTRWITLDLKCAVNPGVMNFTIHVPVAETRLANIYDRIVGRHGGSISNVTIYKDKRYESNILQPLSAYLIDLGFDEGVPEGDPEDYPKHDLVYDFKPQHTQCHLLLSNPHNCY